MPQRPTETFEQLQMRLALETIRELEVKNERQKLQQHVDYNRCCDALHKTRPLTGEGLPPATAIVDQLARETERLRKALVESLDEIRVLKNDLTQLESELDQAKRRIAILELTRVTEEMGGYDVPLKHPPSCPGCDDVTCRGHWR